MRQNGQPSQKLETSWLLIFFEELVASENGCCLHSALSANGGLAKMV